MDALAAEEFYEGLLPKARKVCRDSGLTLEQVVAIEALVRLLMEGGRQ